MYKLLDNKEISEIFLEVICSFFEKDLKAKNFGTDSNLYHSEIHMLQYIKENEGLHISAIARKLEITRGAVSQTIKRLENKGYLFKEASSDSNSKLILKLTEKGEVAYKNHKSYHNQYNLVIKELLRSASRENKEFLYNFLKQFKDKI